METNPSKTHTLSVFQLIMGGVSLLILLAGLLLSLFFGAVMRLIGRDSMDSFQMLPAISVTGALVLLLLPSVVLPIYRLAKRPLPGLRLRRPFRVATLMLMVWPLVVLLGAVADRVGGLAWLPPLLSVLAIGIPVWWLVELGRRGLPSGSLQRSWGLLGYGVFSNVVLIVAVELLALVAIVVAGFVYAGTQPELMQALTRLVEQLQAAGEDPQQMMDLLQPYLRTREAFFLLIAVGAVIAPMIEEALKPLAMWFLAGRFRKPAEGFAAGVVCGGAFGFIESLQLAAGMGAEGWASIVFARLGGGLLHVTLSGLVGWGLVSAWSERRYLRLALAYLAAVLVHGTWNFFGLLLGFWEFLPFAGSGLTGGGLLSPAQYAISAVLVAMAVGMLVMLYRMNRHLHENLPEPAAAQGQLADINESSAGVPEFPQSAQNLVELAPAQAVDDPTGGGDDSQPSETNISGPRQEEE